MTVDHRDQDLSGSAPTVSPTAIRLVLSDKRLEISRNNTSRPIRYCDAPPVRDAVKHFVSTVVTHARDVLFPEVCTQCGVCCTRVAADAAPHPRSETGGDEPEVLVTAKEAFGLARRMEVSDEAFRQRYLRPTSSWNGDDGYLVLDENGDCPFLEWSPDRRFSRCSVHDVRPFSCQAFVPIFPICVKTAGQLIEHLRTIDITSEEMGVVTKSDTRHMLGLRDQPWSSAFDALMAAIRAFDGKTDERVPPIVTGIRKLLQSLGTTLDGDPCDPKARPLLGEIHDLIRRLAAMVDMQSSPSVGDAVASQLASDIEGLWAEVAACERRMEEAEMALTVSRPAGNGPTAIKTDIREVLIMANFVVVSGSDDAPPSTLFFARWPALLAPVRGLLEAVAKWGASDVAVALADLEPPCFLCGECCRAYAVEVMPSDIHRLAWNLGLTYDQVVDDYTVPPRFTWNEGFRILKKRESPRECVFLEKRNDGLYYCSVHAFKPDVCQRYQPTDRLCRQTNDATHWSRFISNIIWVRLFGDRALLHTYRTHTDNAPPLELELGRRPMVARKAAELREAIAGLMAGTGEA